MNEATARIKINRLLERAGWRFFPDGDRSANIRLEQGVSIRQTELDELGDDFDETKTLWPSSATTTGAIIRPWET